MTNVRTYKVDLGPASARGGLLILREEREGPDEQMYWHWVGLFKPEQICGVILPSMLAGDIRDNIDLADKMKDRFTRHFINPAKCFPRIITTRDVLNWIGNQTAAGI